MHYKYFELLIAVNYIIFYIISKYVSFISKYLKILCLNSMSKLKSSTLEIVVRPKLGQRSNTFLVFSSMKIDWMVKLIYLL